MPEITFDLEPKAFDLDDLEPKGFDLDDLEPKGFDLNFETKPRRDIEKDLHDLMEACKSSAKASRLYVPEPGPES